MSSKKLLSVILVFLLIFQQPAWAARSRKMRRSNKTSNAVATQTARTAQTARSAHGVQGIQGSSQSAQTFPVPINKLANYKSLKKKMTNAEFQEAYDVALKIVTPIADWPREEQIRAITSYLRNLFNRGEVMYTTSEPHYNDPYGYFVKGVASCAGCTRATGLCLNILGIPYEHVNENKWDHQWCRIKVGDKYWISDAFIFYYGPEPAPYKHPRRD